MSKVYIIPRSSHVWFSSLLLCFHVGVGTLAVLPINAFGRFTGFPLIAGHSAHVTDFTFSPFHSQLLATGSEDCTVKLWNIPSEPEYNSSLSESVVNFGPFSVRSIIIIIEK